MLHPSYIKKWSCTLWLVFVTVIAFFLSIIVYLAIKYVQLSIGWYYLGAFAIISLLFVANTWCKRSTHDIHVHHYLVGMLLIPMIGYQDYFTAIVHGIFNGIMIEGGARWGYDDIWVR